MHTGFRSTSIGNFREWPGSRSRTLLVSLREIISEIVSWLMRARQDGRARSVNVNEPPLLIGAEIVHALC
jgi:hypothetical protein